MKRLLLLLLLIPFSVQAADCDVISTHDRSGTPWSIIRVLVADADTTTVGQPSTTCTPTTLSDDLPFDFANCWVDESDACTSWALEIREYPTQQTGDCQGTCDPHVLSTLNQSASTSVRVTGPVGEGIDSNITEITACTINVICDFYYRDQGK